MDKPVLKAAVFRGSPRQKGNTNALTDIVIRRLQQGGAEVRDYSLYEMKIGPCTACRRCQEDWSRVSCAISDDMTEVFDAVMKSDLIILATPVYSWYCTPPMKAMLDRLVYAMNMYYGQERGPSLWGGKKLALITTCGYPPEKGSDILEEGIRRYCRHSKLSYQGMVCGRHMGYDRDFMDDDKREQALAFAESLLG